MRKSKPKNGYLPDPKLMIYGDKILSKVHVDGKKIYCLHKFFRCIDIIEEKTKENGLEIWKQSLANVTPALGGKKPRSEGDTFQIPTELRPERKTICRDGKNLTIFEKTSRKTIPC